MQQPPGSASSSETGARGARSTISLYHVGLRYGEHVALDDVSFQVANGEFLFLTGPSGAGKSSVLRLVQMEEQPTSGQLLVGSQLSSKVRRKDIPKLRREMGVVFQDFRLLQDRDVEENVAFAQMVIGVPRRQTKENVARVLNWVGLYHKRKQDVRTLSGGEQQRVAIARAIVNSPKILLADEPTGNLDPKVSREVLDLLFRINAGGTAVLMSTHDHHMVKQFGERILQLEGGKLVADVERILHTREADVRASHAAFEAAREGRQRETERWDSGVLEVGERRDV